MKRGLIDMLLHLAPRERMLLGLLVIIVLPVGIIFGVLLPLHEARERALSDRIEAFALNLWGQERVTEAEALAAVAPEITVRIDAGPSDIEQDLIDAGLRNAVQELRSDGEGVVDLRFDDVRFVRLAEWLSGLDPAWGYDIASFRFEPTDTSGNVAATLKLEPERE